ncbi:MAG: DUF1214 domain-containing protein [Spirochaetes bacterium]|nr:DUF1214 domain-containing protein [Spirochaetota bacterium]
MRSFLKIAALVAAAFLLGAGSFGLAVYFPPEGAIVTNGPWQTDLSVGSKQTGMHMRARVALMGLFALKKSEAVYFIAREDSEGRPLDSSCDYRLEGRDLPARWWSITALGPTFFLIPNDEGRYSVTWANVARERDGRYVIRLSPERKEGNWIPTGSRDAGRINLTLRLYRPPASVLERPGGVELPTIVREACR